LKILKISVLNGYYPGMKQPSLIVDINFSDPPSVKKLTFIEELSKRFLEKSEIQIESNLLSYPGLVCLINLAGSILKKGSLPAYNSILVDAKQNKSIVTFLFPASQYLFKAYCDVLVFSLGLIDDKHDNDLNAIQLKIEKFLIFLSSKAPKDINTSRFIEAAQKHSIPWIHLSNHIYQYGWGANAKILDSTFTEKTPRNAAFFARDKYLCSRLLKKSKFNVAPNYLINDPKELMNIASRIGMPVVIKPNDQDGGRGVSVNLNSADEIQSAYVKAKKFSKNILVEKHIEARDYRFQVLNGKVIWAVEREPGGVVGDGKSSVAELLAQLNSDPIRGKAGSPSLLKEINLDEEAKDLLIAQGVGLNDVPELNRFVRLRKISNIAAGGRPIPILDLVHPDNLDLISRVARVMRLDLCGIDVLVRDISVSWKDEDVYICEVNAQPELSPHLQEEVLMELIKNEGRIPITFICNNSKLDIESEILKINKKGLGVHSKDGIWINRKNIYKGKTDVYEGSLCLLTDPEVKALVSIVERLDCFNMELAYDQIDNLIIMNDIDLELDDKEFNSFKRIAEISNHIIFYDQIKKLPNIINKELSMLSLEQVMEIIEKS